MLRFKCGKVYISSSKKKKSNYQTCVSKGYRGVGSVGSMGARAPVDFRIAL